MLTTGDSDGSSWTEMRNKTDKSASNLFSLFSQTVQALQGRAHWGLLLVGLQEEKVWTRR